MDFVKRRVIQSPRTVPALSQFYCHGRGSVGILHVMDGLHLLANAPSLIPVDFRNTDRENRKIAY